jgi:hypothetical protein
MGFRVLQIKQEEAFDPGMVIKVMAIILGVVSLVFCIYSCWKFFSNVMPNRVGPYSLPDHIKVIGKVNRKDIEIQVNNIYDNATHQIETERGLVSKQSFRLPRAEVGRLKLSKLDAKSLNQLSPRCTSKSTQREERYEKSVKQPEK